MEETIYALSSASGRCGVAVVRVSGGDALGVLKVFGVDVASLSKRYAHYVSLKNPGDGTVLDKAIVVCFKAPHSFTGEDVVELHVHGSRAILSQLFQILDSIKNVRSAYPGEFCKRAFLQGKMDLTEAEGLIDIINAETRVQLQQAQRQASGALGSLYQGWANTLVSILAHCEAYIDFPDEEIPATVEREVRGNLTSLITVISAHLEDNNRGERVREGIRVAVAGAPNAGKSSLVNMLANRDVAIVSNRAGTTRDVIEVLLDIGGYPVRLFDGAGICDTEDVIEAKGVERALATVANADIVLLMIDGCQNMLTDELTNTILQCKGKNALVIVLANKCESSTFQLPEQGVCEQKDVFAISVHANLGIENFLTHLQKTIQEHFSVSPTPLITRNRHRNAIKMCLTALKQAKKAHALELLAEDLRMAHRSLGQITGKTDVDHILDVIFKDFCIGK